MERSRLSDLFKAFAYIEISKKKKISKRLSYYSKKCEFFCLDPEPDGNKIRVQKDEYLKLSWIEVDRQFQGWMYYLCEWPGLEVAGALDQQIFLFRTYVCFLLGWKKNRYY